MMGLILTHSSSCDMHHDRFIKFSRPSIIDFDAITQFISLAESQLGRLASLFGLAGEISQILIGYRQIRIERATCLRQ